MASPFGAGIRPITPGEAIMGDRSADPSQAFLQAFQVASQVQDARERRELAREGLEVTKEQARFRQEQVEREEARRDAAVKAMQGMMGPLSGETDALKRLSMLRSPPAEVLMYPETRNAYFGMISMLKAQVDVQDSLDEYTGAKEQRRFGKVLSLEAGMPFGAQPDSKEWNDALTRFNVGRAHAFASEKAGLPAGWPAGVPVPTSNVGPVSEGRYWEALQTTIQEKYLNNVAKAVLVKDAYTNYFRQITRINSDETLSLMADARQRALDAAAASLADTLEKISVTPETKPSGDNNPLGLDLDEPFKVDQPLSSQPLTNTQIRALQELIAP